MRFDLDNLLGLLFFVVFIILPIFSRGKKKGQPQQGPTTGRAPSAGTGAPASRGATATRPVTLPGQPTASADRGSSATITLEEIRRRVEEAQRREVASRQGAQAPTIAQGSASGVPEVRPARRGLVSSDPFERTLVGGSSPAGMGREGATSAANQPYQTVLGREGGGSSSTQPGTGFLGREGALPSGSTRSQGVLGREGLPGREGPSGAARRAPRSQGTPGPLGREGASRSARAAAAEIGEASDPRQRLGTLTGSKLSPIGPLQFDKRSIMRGLIWHEILGEPPSIKRLRRTRSRLH